MLAKCCLLNVGRLSLALECERPFLRRLATSQAARNMATVVKARSEERMNAPWRLATAALQAAAQAKLQAAKASLLLAPLSFAVSAFLALLQAVPKTPGAPAAAKAIRARFFLNFFVGNSVEASKASAPKSAPAPKPQATHRGASRSGCGVFWALGGAFLGGFAEAAPGGPECRRAGGAEEAQRPESEPRSERPSGGRPRRGLGGKVPKASCAIHECLFPPEGAGAQGGGGPEERPS